MKCPFCGSKKVADHGDHVFHCAACDKYFDDMPEEGGTYFADPTRRLEREEEKAERDRQEEEWRRQVGNARRWPR